MKTRFTHQGDIIFFPVSSLSGSLQEHRGSFILAYGEHSGNKHVLTIERPDDLFVFRDESGRTYIDLRSQGTVTHEEHLPIVLAPGVYEVVREREMDWFAHTVRQVID